MESTEERQELEVTALRSIYGEDFLESPPPKVWKAATRLTEFNIKVSHPNPEHAEAILIHLHTRFPKTYPTVACPVFTVQKPTKGITNESISKLTNDIRAEALKNKGSEMVFQIVSFVQDWLEINLTPKAEIKGSLATQMVQRASEAERLRKEREATEKEEADEREAQMAHELNEQIRADALRQQLARQAQYKTRPRADSEATEIPVSGDVPIESFPNEMEIDGVSFNSVRIFHPQKGFLGTTYLADPVSDDLDKPVPLELTLITFKSHYYTTGQGRKKLKQIESEIQRLTTIRHPNLLSVLAVKLTTPHSSGPPQLSILTERRPVLTLQDILEDCDGLREERSSDYLAQLLTALNVIHAGDLVHRGIDAGCIGLASNGVSKHSKHVKLANVSYVTRLLDLHRSNPIDSLTPVPEPCMIPDAWLSKDVLESPLNYTRSRDLHHVGIILMQMLFGQDVMQKYPDIQSALRAAPASPPLQQQATNMLIPGRKQFSCLTLLAELAETSFHGVNRSSPIAIRSAEMRTPMASFCGSSPEVDIFARPPKQASRWKEDWEELELLGKGGFGSVVKARNKIDSRIYAVKKVKLKTVQSDSKIFREVNALSRLSHRFIVRYFTTWVETTETHSTATSDMDDSMEENMTSVPKTRTRSSEGISVDLADLDDFKSDSKNSFPSIHFEKTFTPGIDEDEGSDSGGEEDDGNAESFQIVFRNGSSDEPPKTPAPLPTRMLYIQMEFVEQQTLKERVAAGLTEDDAWRLFQQIVDALVHMSSLGILHRDIKLTNIFIDARGDCKVGDFGLATSSLAAVDPSDVSPYARKHQTDLTLEVGTRLYIAPEVQSRRKGPQNHTKADIYSLGIVFFEMNFIFKTNSERIAVIEGLRQTAINFPPEWDPQLSRQKEIIRWLLQHNPEKRPSALELSQSPLLPARLEDEYFKGALRTMAKPDSAHYPAVISALFSQPPRLSRRFLYDAESHQPEYVTLNDAVQDRLSALFRLHGAVDMEPPLLMPLSNAEDIDTQATFLDRHGDLVTLPKHLLASFARLAARDNLNRIKRFHIANVYEPNPIAGHPKFSKAAVFDIITPDLDSGALAAGAEILALSNECLNGFPFLSQNYDIHISHSKIVDVMSERIPEKLRGGIFDILTQTKSNPTHRRAALLKKGLLKSTADELELLSEIDDDFDYLLARLEKISPAVLSLIGPVINEIKDTIQFARAMGLKRPFYLHPLMIGSHLAVFKNGIRFEVVRQNKRTDILAVGGRYDDLIARYSPPKAKSDSVCAVGVQISVEKIAAAIATHQSNSQPALKAQRSFGFWSPRRCDVYIASHTLGYLQERLEVVSMLWAARISADVMYEASVTEGELEGGTDMCAREGILFIVYPKTRGARRDLSTFKVKSVLRGTEYEVSRQELVGWLQQQIGEQKKIDAGTSGVQGVTVDPPGSFQILSPGGNKELGSLSDVSVLLPVDVKKQRKHVKQMFFDRACNKADLLRSAIQNRLPVLGLDAPPSAFDALTKLGEAGGGMDDEAWRPVLGAFPPAQAAYAQMVRDAIVKRRAEGVPFLLLYAVREERMHLMHFT